MIGIATNLLQKLCYGNLAMLSRYTANVNASLRPFRERSD